MVLEAEWNLLSHDETVRSAALEQAVHFVIECCMKNPDVLDLLAVASQFERYIREGATESKMLGFAVIKK